MTIRVAINGYGRIGRNVLRAHYEYGKHHDIEIVAINNPGNIDTIALLTKYDTAHGKFPAEVSVDGDYLIVNGDRIRVTGDRNPENLPWKELNIDIVQECTGFFTTKEAASAHIRAGAKKSHHFRSGRQGCRCNRRFRRQPERSESQRHGHFECFLYDELSGTACYGLE